MGKCRHIAAALLTCILTIPAVHAVGDNGEFYQKLTELLYKQDSSHYFSTMQLTIGAPTLLIDEVEYPLDTAPEIQSGRTMLPVRAIAEAMGAHVEFQEGTRLVLITGAHGEKIALSIGESSIQINDVDYPLDAPSYIKNGWIYIPLRAVAEALNLEVDWNPETSVVTLTAPYQTARLLVLAETLDIKDLGAQTVLFDGYDLWVLQFSTPAQAKEALQILTQQGIDAEPDLYVTANLN